MPHDPKNIETKDNMRQAEPVDKKFIILQVGVPAVAALLGAIIGGVYPSLQADREWERTARQDAYAQFYGVAQAKMRGSDMCTDVSDELYEAVLGIDLYGSERTVDLAYNSIGAVREFREHRCSRSLEDAEYNPDRDGDGQIEGPATEILIKLAESMRQDLEIRN